MKKLTFFLACIVIGATASYGQSDSTRYVKYLSVQSNQLLRQLVNFGGSSQGVSNPYLLNFSINNRKNGVGFNVGLGNQYNKLINEPDDGGNSTSIINDFDLRIGLDKKRILNNRWWIGGGFDLLYQYSSNSTKSLFINESNLNGNPVDLETKNDLKTTANTFGFGPRFNFGFNLSPRIMLMTEVTYYYTAMKSTSALKSSRDRINFVSGNQILTTDETDTEDILKSKSTQLNLPVVVYLTFSL